MENDLPSILDEIVESSLSEGRTGRSYLEAKHKRFLAPRRKSLVFSRKIRSALTGQSTHSSSFHQDAREILELELPRQEFDNVSVLVTNSVRNDRNASPPCQTTLCVKVYKSLTRFAVARTTNNNVFLMTSRKNVDLSGLKKARERVLRTTSNLGSSLVP